MDSRKIFIIILILIAIAFVALTVVGAGRQSGTRNSGSQASFDPTQMAQQFGAIRDSLARPPSITAKELRPNPAASTSPDCLKLQSDLYAPAGATCTFTIAPAERSVIGTSPAVRKLKLALIEGASAALTLVEKVRQDNGNQLTVTAEQALLPGAAARPLDVYQAGGSLTIACTELPGSSAACRLRLSK